MLVHKFILSRYLDHVNLFLFFYRFFYDFYYLKNYDEIIWKNLLFTNKKVFII